MIMVGMVDENVLTLNIERVNSAFIKLLEPEFFSGAWSRWIDPCAVYFPEWVEGTLACDAACFLKFSQLAIDNIEAMVAREETGKNHIKLQLTFLLLHKIRIWILFLLHFKLLFICFLRSESNAYGVIDVQCTLAFIYPVN